MRGDRGGPRVEVAQVAAQAMNEHDGRARSAIGVMHAIAADINELAFGRKPLGDAASDEKRERNRREDGKRDDAKNGVGNSVPKAGGG